MNKKYYMKLEGHKGQNIITFDMDGISGAVIIKNEQATIKFTKATYTTATTTIKKILLYLKKDLNNIVNIWIINNMVELITYRGTHEIDLNKLNKDINNNIDHVTAPSEEVQFFINIHPCLKECL